MKGSGFSFKPEASTTMTTTDFNFSETCTLTQTGSLS